MARTIKETFRQFLPGAGRDTSGNPKQGKTRVVGQIDVTSYAGGGGENLSATDLGLTRVDAINLRVENEVPGSDGLHRAGVSYAKDSGKFYLFNEDEAGTKTHAAASATETLEYIAEGDSALDVELT